MAETQYLVKNLNEATVYYWRVLSVNLCGQAVANSYSRFDTGTQNCSNVFMATDFSDAAIATVENSTGSVPIMVTGGITVGNLTISLNIKHEYLGDIMVYLEGPEAIGYPRITLFEEPCGDFENINATLSDNGTAFTCGGNPAISGTIAPKQPLSNFNNLPADGQWTLYVVDNYDNDGGTINSATLNFCNVVSANLTAKEQQRAKISVYPNPTKGILNVQLPGNSLRTKLSLFDIQGRSILSQTTNTTTGTLHIGNLQDGVYLLSIENEEYKTSKKIILNK